MYKFSAFVLTIGLVAGAAQAAFATDTASEPSTKGPKCAAGDPTVLVDTKSKTYSLAAANPGQAGSAGESASQNTDKGGLARDSSEVPTGNASPASGADYTQMCKSKADAMGAKMMAKKGSLLNSKVGAGGSH